MKTFLSAAAIAASLFVPLRLTAEDAAVLTREFIYETAPFPSCHASTIVEPKPGELVAAWFGGTAEKNPDVCIWVSRKESGGWTTPQEVANGLQADGTRHPTWNPVLFQPKDGPLMLFYKVGPSPSTWWGELRTSGDGGRTWSDARRLPEGILGPIKNKPIQLADGTILSPSSVEGLSPPPDWQAHIERSSDGGHTWTKNLVPVDAKSPGAIQPSLLQHADGSLQALGRSRGSRIFTTSSTDGGKTWSKLELTTLPNPNSGTDAVTVADGSHLLIYNHTQKGRSPLNLASSRDGKTWEAALVLESEPGEYSYPAIIQSSDGLVHATYTWKRQKIRHAVIDPKKLEPKPLVDGAWPK
ncbi:MAG: exo-alpha-sialidase [Planctomycetes bacterium]|nr:exo-alpha-sialidase [Planctomycetota bacterium]